MKKYFNKSKIKTVIVLVTVVLSSFSCDDMLDKQPISEIGLEKFWKSNADARLAVVGMYDAMQPTYKTNHFLWGEFRGDSYTPSGGATSQNIELVLQGITAENRSVLKWNNLYILINRANQCIKYIPTISGYDKNLLAEAYATRAFTYFDAIRVWGAVPLFTEPTESIVDIQRSRTAGATILTDVIIPDMLKAEELMIVPSSNFRFSKASIYCLQAEVYMWTKQYDKAKVALDKLIALNTHSLVTTVEAWEDLFYNTPIGPSTPTAKGKKQIGPELIFSIRYDLVDTDRSGIFGLFNTGIPQFTLSKNLETKWKERFPIDKVGWETKYPGIAPGLSNTTGPIYGDWRYFLCGVGGSNSLSNGQLTKFTKLAFNGSLDDTDIVKYRYAGMLLLLAEAENQLNNEVRALALVNQIRTARKLPLVTVDEFGATKDDRENYILEERQFELLGEGQRWWDLRRTDKAISVINPLLASFPNATLLTPDRLLFPVFSEHLIENPKLLPQNPGF